MRCRPARLAIVVAFAASAAAAQSPPGSETQVLTFAVTAPPPPPLSAPSPAASTPAPPRGSWVVSETRSPVDYAPVAIATSVAISDDAPRLSIQCRGGQTELLVLLPASPTGRETVSLAIEDEPPRVLRVAPSATQAGVVLRDAPQRFLDSLPAHGTLSLRVVLGPEPATESRLDLATLATVRDRLAGPCGWPQTPK